MKHVNKALPVCLIVLGLVCTGCTSSSMLQMEENKAIVRRAVEELDRSNLAAFMELHASDYVYHGHGSAKPMTREEFEQSFHMGFAAFGDTSRTIEDMVAEGNKVAFRLGHRFTHKGEFQGIPATGKQVTFTSIIIVRIAGGKFVEAWEEFDELSFRRQLGAVPSDE